jgi:threonine/homoserine efflux transporter RhtA
MLEMTRTQKKRFYLGIFFCALGIVVLTLSYPTYYDVLAVPFGICITVGFCNTLVAVLDPQEKKVKVRECDDILFLRRLSFGYLLIQQYSVSPIECRCSPMRIRTLSFY